MSADIPEFCLDCKLSPEDRLLCVRYYEELTMAQQLEESLPCNRTAKGIGIIANVVTDPYTFNNRDHNPNWGTAKTLR